MKIFTSTNDYGDMPKSLRDHIEYILEGELGVFDSLLGGDIFLLERVEELSEITVDYEEGRTAADTVAPLDSVDNLGDLYTFFLATNDAGGPLYVVPKWMYDHCIILQSIFKATEAMFQKA